MVWSLKVKAGDGSQASVAEAVLNCGVAGQSIVCGPPTPCITGLLLSCTVMVRDAVAVLPQALVAVQVLVTLYSCAQLPAVVSSAKVTAGDASQSSAAVAVPKDG